MCDQVCPDFCLIWKKNPLSKFGAELVGIDYQYCKGCQKCIEVCPVKALTRVPEEEISETEKSLSWLRSLK
jgi:pyruvate ferredoxin oxidoreductase gamma subunit